MSQFHYNIVSYDFHTYFKLDDPEETEFANKFKESIEKEFKPELEAGQASVYDTWLEPVGPHPDGYGMFEIDTGSPDAFLKLFNFYQLNHGNLNVLIHPRSDRGALKDHTEHAAWLGNRLPLKPGPLTE